MTALWRGIEVFRVQYGNKWRGEMRRTQSGCAKRMLLLLTVILTSVCVRAQTNFQGQPLIAKTTTSYATDQQGTIVDAFVYVKPGGSSGPDICHKVLDSWGTVQSGGSATIDARGFVDPALLNCATNPFLSDRHGRLLLGNGTILTSAQWQIPSGVEVIGLGPPGPPTSQAVNTIIQAASTLPTGIPVVLMGLSGISSGQYGVKIKDLGVDCNYVSDCIGIENSGAGIGSTVEDVTINNAPKPGLHVVVGDPAGASPMAAYSGPYRNVTVQYPLGSCGNCASNKTDGVKVECAPTGSECATVVEFDNITSSGISNATNIEFGFYTDAVPVILTNSHFENYFKGQIHVGSGSRPTHNVRIENVSLSSSLQQGGGVAIAGNATDVVLVGISGPSSSYGLVLNNYPDPEHPTTVAAQFLGFYMIGVGTNWLSCASGACPAFVSTYSARGQGLAFKWHAPAGYVPSPP